MLRSRFVTLSALVVLAACASPSPDTTGGEAELGTIASADTSDSLVITEIFYDPSDATPAESFFEWVEVYNPTNQPIDVTTLGIKAGNSIMVQLTAVNGGKVAPGEYAVLAARPEAIVATNKVKGTYGNAIKLANDGLSVTLTRVATLVVVDTVAYDDIFPWPTGAKGKSIQLGGTPSTTANDAGLSWCRAGATYGSWTAPNGTPTPQYGTPGLVNGTCDITGAAGSSSGTGTLTPVPGAGGNGGAGGGVNPPGLPAANELVISELMINPTAPADTGEWFEVHNPTDKSFDLRGVQIVSNAVTHVIDSTQPILAEPGSYLVFAHSSSVAENGGLPKVDYVYPAPLALSDSIGDGLAIRVIDGGGGVLYTIDEVSYGAAELPGLVGTSRSLSPDQLDSVENDDASAWCPATSTFGTSVPKDHGTPGKANDVCSTGTGGAAGSGNGGAAGGGGAAGSGTAGSGTAGSAGAGTAGSGTGGASAGEGGSSGSGASAGEGGSGAGEGGSGAGEGGSSAGEGGSDPGEGGKSGTAGSTSSKGGAAGKGGSAGKGGASGKGGAAGKGGSTTGKGGTGGTGGSGGTGGTGGSSSSGKGGSTSGKGGAGGAAGGGLAVQGGDDGGCSVSTAGARSGDVGVGVLLASLLAGLRRSRRGRTPRS